MLFYAISLAFLTMPFSIAIFVSLSDSLVYPKSSFILASAAILSLILEKLNFNLLNFLNITIK